MLRLFKTQAGKRRNSVCPVVYSMQASLFHKHPLIYKFQEVHAYPSGPVLSAAYTNEKQDEIAFSKSEMKGLLSCQGDKNTDLAHFLDRLFDYDLTVKTLKKIDAHTKEIVRHLDPRLFSDYQKILRDNKPEKLHAFFKDRFLPQFRMILQELARYYGFDSTLVEINDGVMLDDDYIDFIQEGKLILDLGETGHGPLPHILAAFMMAEMEKEGRIASALTLYQSLAERCDYYCPDRMNYVHRYLIVLDFPNDYRLTATQFCNPSSLSNHILFHGDTLKKLAIICKNHSHALAEISRSQNLSSRVQQYGNSPERPQTIEFKL